MDISSSINTSAKAIKMPIIKSNQLALEVQDKLNFLLSKNSHSFGDLLPMDAAKACEIAFRLQPEMFNLNSKTIETLLINLAESPNGIQFVDWGDLVDCNGMYFSESPLAVNYDDCKDKIIHSSIKWNSRNASTLVDLTRTMNHELNHLFFDLSFCEFNRESWVNFEDFIRMRRSWVFITAIEMMGWFAGKYSLICTIWSNIAQDMYLVDSIAPSIEWVTEEYLQWSRLGNYLALAYMNIHDYLGQKYGFWEIREPKKDRFNRLLDWENEKFQEWIYRITQIIPFYLIKNPHACSGFENFLSTHLNNPEKLLYTILDYKF